MVDKAVETMSDDKLIAKAWELKGRFIEAAEEAKIAQSVAEEAFREYATVMKQVKELGLIMEP